MCKVNGVLAVVCLSAVTCFGQGTTATLSGTASDASGASISEVTIRATNLSTNAIREAKTDAAGNYSIPFLPTGDYKVSAAREGFQMQQNDRVTLQVDQNARIDFILQVGSVNETVNVSASTVLLQTENATVGTVIDGGKIVDLPLNGRNFIQLAQLIPGVQAGTPVRLRCGAAAVPWGKPTPAMALPPPRRTVARYRQPLLPRRSRSDGLRRDDLQLLAVSRLARRIQG